MRNIWYRYSSKVKKYIVLHGEVHISDCIDPELTSLYSDYYPVVPAPFMESLFVPPLLIWWLPWTRIWGSPSCTFSIGVLIYPIPTFSLDCKWHGGKHCVYLYCLYSQSLEQCVVHRRCSLYVCCIYLEVVTPVQHASPVYNALWLYFHQFTLQLSPRNHTSSSKPFFLTILYPLFLISSIIFFFLCSLFFIV